MTGTNVKMPHDSTLSRCGPVKVKCVGNSDRIGRDISTWPPNRVDHYGISAKTRNSLGKLGPIYLSAAVCEKVDP
jgi:hypothetical protein